MNTSELHSLVSDINPLIKKISCNFIDARITTKEFVKKTADHYRQSIQLTPNTNTFLISTCLRCESYNLSSQPPLDGFCYIRSITCIRRLLSVLVGLQSEIVGEQEIYIQATQGLQHAYEVGEIDESSFHMLKKLFTVAEYIREQSKVTTEENYSTVAADLFVEHLTNRPNAVIAIVGGGYMAEKFFSAILRIDASDPLKINKIYWVNRSTEKIHKNIASMIDVLDFDIEVVDLDDGAHIIPESDAVFCALSNLVNNYADLNLKDGSLIVDVSYPQIFVQKDNIKLINISNTYFEKLVKNPISKRSINNANIMIDSVCEYLEKVL